MPAEKPISKSSENRKSSKPIMEKRRRARINQSLGELKSLILDAMKKDSSRHSKLEKADILEMTVLHLQNLQRQQVAAAISTDPSVMSKFRAGFNECASEISRYLVNIDGVDTNVRQRILNHLAGCINGLNVVTAPMAYGTVPSSISPVQPVQIQMPNNTLPLNLVPKVQLSPVGEINSNINTTTTTVMQTTSAAAMTKIYGGFQLIPGALPNGELALLLPSHALAGTQLPSHVIPVYAHATALNSPSINTMSPSPIHSIGSTPSPNSLSPSSTNCSSTSTLSPISLKSSNSDSESVWRPW
uniref:Transcription factor n=1 Tax=Euperipatoides kanangrensis TaxID=488523 RepID=S6DLL9_9BILA|nr:transcription factor [Euperipatoides kanangrensis]